jgi:hypothetical protein
MEIKTDVSTTGAIPPAKHHHLLVVPIRQRCSKHLAASELLDLSAHFCFGILPKDIDQSFRRNISFGSYLQGGTMDGRTD